MPALTIFPGSSAIKVSYDTINDSLGRTIDRCLGCEPQKGTELTQVRFIPMLAMVFPDDASLRIA